MLDSPIIDVAIGLILVYLILSIVCSAVQEAIASILSWRAATLRQGVDNLVSSPLGQKVFDHGLIKGLTKPGKSGPSYIPGRIFATAIVDLLAELDPAKSQGGKPPTIRETIDAIENPAAKRALLALYDQADADVDKFRDAVEGWFDDAMDRVSGWYARRAKAILAVIAAVVVVALNADTVRIAATLWTDDAVRSRLVALAENAAGQDAPPDQDQALDTVAALPLGWLCHPSAATPTNGDASAIAAAERDVTEIRVCFVDSLHWTAVVGWPITVLAITFGAPFWFDLLGRAVRLRGAGKQPPRQGGGR
ncbi:MAG: hypothetical protein GVY28_01555 [Alphaproteobacteria bacterium]|jgi:hypothetical protein|nr:hypothetical protein [Alphaproteobacteria bacterium]